MSENRSKIPVVILCGGLGTRIREETEFKPKPMVEIGGRPLLWHIMKMYAHHGFLKFILCLGYKGNIIKDFFLNYEPMSNDFTVHLGRQNRVTFQSKHREQDFDVTMIDTGLKTMTGGRLKRIEQFIDTDAFMVTYGDGLANADLGGLFEFHLAHKKLATLTAVQPPSRFGIVDLSDDDRVLRFREKAQQEWINGGFFAFNRGVFEYLDQECVLEKRPLEQMAAEGEIKAFRHRGFWIGMDTYREYEMMNDMWNSGEAPWKVW